MAVENQTPPVQPATPKAAVSRDFIQVISAAAALAAVIIAGMALVVSIIVAPVRDDLRLLRDDLRLLRTDMQRGFETTDTDMQRGFETTNAESKAIRKDIATLSERLMRVETLLESHLGQIQTAPRPGTQPE